jgi:tetratricopeptide (TPR) repeat protein
MSDHPEKNGSGEQQPAQPRRGWEALMAGHELFLCFLLAVIVFAAYWPVLSHDFTNYDDPNYVTANADVQRGLTWARVSWAFCNPVVGNWHPLTMLSHMLDCQLFGLRPAGHHLTNLLLHMANTVLLFAVLRCLTGALWRSAFVAALFALHPLHVESVAWVAERKDVLSTLFWMLTLWAYARHAHESKAQNPKSWVWYGVSLVMFACGLMSKAMLVTLPFVMLLLDYWPLERFQRFTLWPLVREKLPFFLFSAISCLVTFWTQKKADSVASLDDFSLMMRIENALMAYTRYLGKTFWPSDLAVFYPHPGYWSVIDVMLAAVFVGGLCLVVLRFARRLPFLVTGWFWFLGTLIPVIGLVQVGSQSMSDRYTYIPLIGVFIIFVWSLAGVCANWRLPKAVIIVVAVFMLGVCANLTTRQLGYWHDSDTLFRHALAVTRNNHIAHYNLGTDLLGRGKVAEAVAQFKAALAIRLDDKVLSNLGVALVSQGRLDEAVAQYHAALRLNPNDASTLSNLGVTLVKQGKIEEAVAQFRAALRIKPDHVETLSNLGGALLILGRYDEAIASYEAALRIKPDFVEIRLNLASLLARAGRGEESIEQYRRLLERVPNDVGIHNALGGALAMEGKAGEAIEHFRAALRSKPDEAVTHDNLASALAMQGKLDEAIEHFKESLRLNPNRLNTRMNYGNALAKNGRLDEAIEQYTEALRLNPNHALAHEKLADAFKTQGRGTEAKKHYLASITAEPENAEAHYQLGIIFENEGVPSQAISHLREAIRLKPDSDKFLNSLAWILATDINPALRNGPEAVQTSERAARLTDFKNPSILDTLAAAYAETGHFAEAIQTAEKAIDLAITANNEKFAAEVRTRLKAYKSGQPHRERR